MSLVIHATSMTICRKPFRRMDSWLNVTLGRIRHFVEITSKDNSSNGLLSKFRRIWSKNGRKFVEKLTRQEKESSLQK